MSCPPARSSPRSQRSRSIAYLVTCEHGGNRIPQRYAALFRGQRRLLESHRGYDPGALSLARSLGRTLPAPLVASTVSRLLIELNRSAGHRNLHAPIVRSARAAIRDELWHRYYLPYRRRVIAHVEAALAKGKRVVHISAHSFTPELDGRRRTAEVGFLYDPRQRMETMLCRRWQVRLRQLAPAWRVRLNYPYRGTGDGLTRVLRKKFGATRYAGIELEVNQALYFAGPRAWARARTLIVASVSPARGG
jgi:predicted N-formylglutamate amidohydrolase